MPSILFLCTANQIRSPFAAAYFQKLLAANNGNRSYWKIDSAGTWANPRLPADLILQKLAPDWELNFRDHHTKQVDEKLLADFNLVLVMEKGQKEALHYEFPQYAEKVLMLTEICTTPYDFPDPQGFDKIQKQKCLNEIANYLDSNFAGICKKAENM